MISAMLVHRQGMRRFNLRGQTFDLSKNREAIRRQDSLPENFAARVADIACGHGHSSIAIALAYPKARVDGLDLDAASIERATEQLPGSGVEDRVKFQRRADRRLRLESLGELLPQPLPRDRDQ